MLLFTFYIFQKYNLKLNLKCRKSYWLDISKLIIPHTKMFILTKMKSVVRLDPNTFERELPDALSEALTEKLANKVLKDVGLVIALWDILSIGDSFLFPGDGASHTRVEFRILVFRPFMEEVLTGKVIAIISRKDVLLIWLMKYK